MADRADKPLYLGFLAIVAGVIAGLALALYNLARMIAGLA